MPADRPSVLVAVEDEARRRMRAVLSDCRLTFVRTLSQLTGCLRTEGFDLLLIGSRFDAGSLAALSEALRIQPACPVVCLATRALGPWTNPCTYAEFRSACLELGAYDTVDLARWRDPEDNLRLRELLESAPFIRFGGSA